MTHSARPHGYQGGYLTGFIITGVVALRAMLFHQAQPKLIVSLMIAVYALLYSLEPWLSNRFRWHKYFYFPLQTALVITLSNLRPFLDFQSLLYFPLFVQAFRSFPRQAAINWSVFLIVLLGITLMTGLGWLEGLVLSLHFLAVGAFLLSYDFLYSRTQAEQTASQQLLADLQSAHQKLQEQAAQAEELAAARERNRLARELHDTVSQLIFTISLTSRSTQILLEKDPARAAEQIDSLQRISNMALSELRSLITQLRPEHTKPPKQMTIEL